MRKRLCHMCKVEPIKKGVQKYCGSYKKKTGCSYINYRKIQNVSLAKWRKNNPQDWKRTEKWRNKTGWYKKPEVAEHRKNLSRNRYYKKKLAPSARE